MDGSHASAWSSCDSPATPQLVPEEGRQDSGRSASRPHQTVVVRKSLLIDPTVPPRP